MKLFFIATLSMVAVANAEFTSDILSSEYIAEVNSKALTWTAGRNFDESTPTSFLQKLLGAQLPINASSHLETKPEVEVDLLSIPTSFDARNHWRTCKTIQQIRDQGNCGSCWSVAAASAMSDRICIHSNSSKQISISAIDLTSCCGPTCGTCGGGLAEYAWKYWVQHGLVSGGEYRGGGCKPYPFPNCRSYQYSVREDDLTPKCEKKCTNSKIIYANDLHKGKSSYHVRSNVLQIQKEIMENGPVEAGMTVYEDFMSYKSGVYRHTTDKIAGGHYVKLLGWGVEGTTPYWLGANSWCDIWGINGFFKIYRGIDESGIEKDVFAGIPQ